MLEQALTDILRAEPVFDKATRAVGRRPFTMLDQLAEEALAAGAISQEEAALLTAAEASRLRTINVDDFDPLELVVNKASFDDSMLNKAA
jgi:acyl-CoA dehydrogenase